MSGVTLSGVVPCLWFDGQAEEAARFYCGLFPDSGIDAVIASPVDWPAGHAGDVLTVQFRLAGCALTAINGGPNFAFTPAISLQALCADQAMIDRLWDALSAVPEAEMCGWCTDRYGLSWQIVPDAMPRWMADAKAAPRVMAEVMAPMKKLNWARLAVAAAGA